MKFGFTVPTRGPLATPDIIKSILQEGEKLGFDFASVNDHIVVPRTIASTYPYSEDGDWAGRSAGEALELLSMLCFMAGVTDRMRLLTAVMVVPYRNPVLTARILATADVLTNGRITVGCGAGWLREEFEALDTPPFEERGRVTDEYLKVFKKIWTEPAPEFSGDYTSFKDISVLPLPVQKPHPPLWIGGESNPALRRAARIGDGWFPIANNPKFPLDNFERYKASVDKIRSLAETEGRDPSSIDLAYSLNWLFGEKPPLDNPNPALTGEPEEFAADVDRFGAFGLNHLLLTFQDSALEPTLERMNDFAERYMSLAR